MASIASMASKEFPLLRKQGELAVIKGIAQTRLLRIEGHSFVVGCIVYRGRRGDIRFERMAPLAWDLLFWYNGTPEEFIQFAQDTWKTEWL